MADPRDAAFSFVTLNTWRLRESERVAPLLGALAALARDLGGEPGALPDVIAFQELEADEPLALLRERLAPTHALETLVCARNARGRNRSVVGVAVRRARFAVAARSELSLGRLWPDHPRAALALRLRAADEGPVGGGEAARVDVVSVHLSSRPYNAPQAARLVAALREDGLWDAPRVVLAGDLNFPRASSGYRLLTAGPLRDAFPDDRAPTHLLGQRLDHVFVGPALSAVRALDRAAALAAIGPTAARDLLPTRRRPTPPRAPVSDHLPVGGRFRSAVSSAS